MKFDSSSARKVFAFLILIAVFLGIPLIALFMSYEFKIDGEISGYFRHVIDFALNFNIFEVWFLFLIFELIMAYSNKAYIRENIFFIFLFIFLLYFFVPWLSLYFFVVLTIYWSIRQFIVKDKIRKIWIILLIVFSLLTVFDSVILNKIYYQTSEKIVEIELITPTHFEKKAAEKMCLDYAPECKFITVKNNNGEYNCVYGCSKSYNTETLCSGWSLCKLK